MGGIEKLISSQRLYHRYERDTSEDQYLLRKYDENGNPFTNKTINDTPLIPFKPPSMTIDENDIGPLGNDIMTSSAINGFIKCAGSYIQFMECMPIIASEIFTGLCDVYLIYLVIQNLCILCLCIIKTTR